jgi:anti-sigma regulatory factor (Ser/Thr protein kinase)
VHPSDEQEQMTADQTSAWVHRALPVATGGLGRWSWGITRPAELTAARRELRRGLSEHELPTGADEDDVDRLLLAFEELTSNGLRHGGGRIEVQVDGCGEGWLIDVSDGRPDHPPVPAVGRDPALGGLGLHLVARLSTAHGWAVSGARKHVWAALCPAT